MKYFGSFRSLSLVSIVLSALTFSAALFTLFYGGRVAWNDGCGDDGSLYCAMANGEVVGPPYNRRVLMPALVRLMHPEGVATATAFGVLNIGALLVTACLTGALIFRAATRMGGEVRPSRLAGVSGGSLLLLLPFGFHWSWFYPVLVDNFATALGLAWFYLDDLEDRRFRRLGMVFAPLAVLSRETWLPIILVVMFLRFVKEKERRNLWLYGITMAALGLSAAFILLRPGEAHVSLDGRGLPSYVLANLRHFFTTSAGIEQVAWMLLFTFGLLPLLLKFRRTRRIGNTMDNKAHLLMLACGAGLLTQFVIAISGGVDLHRYLFSAAPFLLCMIMTRVALEPPLGWHLTAAAMASLPMWRPFHQLDGSKEQYLEFFGPHYISAAVHERVLADLRSLLWPSLVWLCLWLAGKLFPKETVPTEQSR